MGSSPFHRIGNALVLSGLVNFRAVGCSEVIPGGILEIERQRFPQHPQIVNLIIKVALRRFSKPHCQSSSDVISSDLRCYKAQMECL